MNQAGSSVVWDAVVVGAGPAGAIASRELSRRGHRVLLLDKAKFPRPKVCGCCVNGAAQASLARLGLGHVLTRLGAVSAERVRLCSAGRSAELPLRAVAVSRQSFDMALINEAVLAGVIFRDHATATLGQPAHEHHTLRVQDDIIATRLIIAADGLAGTLLRNDQAMSPRIASRSRMGAGLILDQPPRWYRPGTIVMACGREGYVGAVRLEDGRLNLAAALAPDFVRTLGGPGAAVSRILTEAGLDADEQIQHGAWHGTGLLTRRRGAVAQRRLLVIGDATGYIEPFTGEGMAWAIDSAVHAAPIASHAIEHWTDDTIAQWTQRYAHLSRQRLVCRAAAALLRRPRLTTLAVAMLSRVPWLASPVLHSIDLSPTQGNLA